MPWKESNKMETRKKFVLRLLRGDKMSDLCREFEISRKTGSKFYSRFLKLGQAGLTDLSRRPKRMANLLAPEVSTLLLRFKKDKPTWGAPKLRELFKRKYPHIKLPAISTIHALLVANDLVKHRRGRSSYKATGTYLSIPKEPNDLWCTDYKGQFRMLNNQYCYPLTISDQVSRMILAIEAMERISEDEAMKVFKLVFMENGLPGAMRSDNGVPFASQSLFGLSKLSIWWLRLGIKLERIEPGNPQQNACHERMHRTLKSDTTKPPSANILAQQDRFYAYMPEFNCERPHEALNMKTPSEVYKKSPKPFPQILEEPNYLDADKVCKVTNCGCIVMNKNWRIWIGVPFAGQHLGVTQVEDKIWEVSFMNYALGYVDENSYKLNPGKNPFVEVPTSN